MDINNIQCDNLTDIFVDDSMNFTLDLKFVLLDFDFPSKTGLDQMPSSPV